MTIEEFLKKYNQPSFRLKQFYRAYYQNYITTFSELTNWPLKLRQEAEEQVPLLPLKVVRVKESKNKDTIKVLFCRPNSPEQLFEAVLMKHKNNRNTVCLSTMIGCPMNCAFCATGKMGFIANLSAAEIVGQALYFARILKKEGESISNLVYMGMGEPLANLTNTLESIAIFTDPEKIALSPTRITISTCGLVVPLKKLLKENYKGRLALSLHAPNQKLREQLMPSAKENSLVELFEVLDSFVAKNNKRITYEYILINQLNDHKQQAEELVQLLKGRLAHVNLIPYNKTVNNSFTPPSRNRVFAFAAILEKHRIPHSIRTTMGADIQAACGQLATKTT